MVPPLHDLTWAVAVPFKKKCRFSLWYKQIHNESSWSCCWLLLPVPTKGVATHPMSQHRTTTSSSSSSSSASRNSFDMQIGDPQRWSLRGLVASIVHNWIGMSEFYIAIYLCTLITFWRMWVLYNWSLFVCVMILMKLIFCLNEHSFGGS